MENKRLFLSLRQQLAYEIYFARNVSRPYRDAPKGLDIIDFEYRGMSCKLILNGNLILQTQKGSEQIDSYHDLVKGLIDSNNPRKQASASVF